MFIAHIGAMDAFARGLRNAARMIEEGVMQNMLWVIIITAIHGLHDGIYNFINIEHLRLNVNHPSETALGFLVKERL